jgi:hypothetical protein
MCVNQKSIGKSSTHKSLRQSFVLYKAFITNEFKVQFEAGESPSSYLRPSTFPQAGRHHPLCAGKTLRHWATLKMSQAQ